MISATTTEEVRAMAGSSGILHAIAIPIAEERDQLAVEVSSLEDEIHTLGGLLDDREMQLAEACHSLREVSLLSDEHAAEVARLRPLAELGALALAWGRALMECAAARDAVKHATDLPAALIAQNRAIDDAWGARAKVASAAMRMAEEKEHA